MGTKLLLQCSLLVLFFFSYSFFFLPCACFVKIEKSLNYTYAQECFSISFTQAFSILHIQPLHPKCFNLNLVEMVRQVDLRLGTKQPIVGKIFTFYHHQGLDIKTSIQIRKFGSIEGVYSNRRLVCPIYVYL